VPGTVRGSGGGEGGFVGGEGGFADGEGWFAGGEGGFVMKGHLLHRTAIFSKMRRVYL